MKRRIKVKGGTRQAVALSIMRERRNLPPLVSQQKVCNNCGDNPVNKRGDICLDCQQNYADVKISAAIILG